MSKGASSSRGLSQFYTRVNPLCKMFGPILRHRVRGLMPSFLLFGLCCYLWGPLLYEMYEVSSPSALPIVIWEPNPQHKKGIRVSSSALLVLIRALCNSPIQEEMFGCVPQHFLYPFGRQIPNTRRDIRVSSLSTCYTHLGAKSPIYSRRDIRVSRSQPAYLDFQSTHITTDFGA